MFQNVQYVRVKWVKNKHGGFPAGESGWENRAPPSQHAVGVAFVADVIQWQLAVRKWVHSLVESRRRSAVDSFFFCPLPLISQHHGAARQDLSTEPGHGRAGGARRVLQQQQQLGVTGRWERTAARRRRRGGGQGAVQHPGDPALPAARMGPFRGGESTMGGGAGRITGENPPHFIHTRSYISGTTGAAPF